MSKKLTKFSEKNLRVIQNFLLYIQKEEEYGQSAIDYIAEDHVDGEDSPQALYERAMGSELILEDVFLQEDSDEENPCTIYADDEFIYCVANNSGDVSLYKLTDDQDKIAKEHRNEILEYCIGEPIGDVSLGDIFLHGKYVKKLNG
jgi:hypothetical protein